MQNTFTTARNNTALVLFWFQRRRVWFVDENSCRSSTKRTGEIWNPLLTLNQKEVSEVPFYECGIHKRVAVQ